MRRSVLAVCTGASGVLALAITASCGARSSLEVSVSATGAGGDQTASSSTVGVGAGSDVGASSTGGGGGLACGFGGAGVGGAPVVEACSAIQAEAEVLAIGGGDEDDDQPNLVPIANAGRDVAVVFASRANGGSSEARIATFDGWDAWPPPTPPSRAIEVPPHESVSVGRLLAAPYSDGEFSLLYEHQPPNFTVYAVGLLVCGGEDADAFRAGGTPLALVPSADASGFLGMLSRRNKAVAEYLLDFQVGITNGGLNFSGQACSTTPICAGAASTPTGWLFGAAAGTALLSGDCDPGAVGPATLLNFAALDEVATKGGPKQLRPNGTLTATSTVKSLVLVPSGDGARAVWAVEGGGPLATATIDATAAVLTTGTLDMGASELDGAAFDAAELGTGFAVAAPTTQQTIHVGVFDATGALLASADAPLTGTVQGRVHALASAGRQSLLVAWSEEVPGLSGRELHIARFDCASP